MEINKKDPGYQCWLSYSELKDGQFKDHMRKLCGNILVDQLSPVMASAAEELTAALGQILGIKINKINAPSNTGILTAGIAGKSKIIDENLTADEASRINEEGFLVKYVKTSPGIIIIAGKTDRGVLYGVFDFLLKIRDLKDPEDLYILENPCSNLRIINQWDNMDGSIERGYAGRSIFYSGNKFLGDFERITDYARLLVSIGINGIVLNNVNVKKYEAMFITDEKLPDIKKIADIFERYAIKTYLCINYASPIMIDGLKSADPLDPEVIEWWKKRAGIIYKTISGFGGFLVKADSEFNPGPFTYNRDHAQGANMLAEALAPFGGIVIWRCFVYNCVQDWRDRVTDRARSAYDVFKPLDGKFLPNVVLQIKNGPMDFQVREPVSPLFGGLEKTNQIIELQITQEYTGQQKHLCYLGTQWKTILDFDTYADGKGSAVSGIVTGKVFPMKYSGFAGVSNIGRDQNWTGHDLAQANLFAYGKLSWNPSVPADDISMEWAGLTFGNIDNVDKKITSILMDSWEIYESYTAPLGIGWMVNPNQHYGPSVDGYEYSRWGTYHRADCKGIGVDRTIAKGTGFTGLYHKSNTEIYESIGTCPDELILFFHYLPYSHKLKSGKSIIEHIYDSHFEGVDKAGALVERWMALKESVDQKRFLRILDKFKEQFSHSKEWRDVINSYFYRKTGIPDMKGRLIY
jgi:alpha-glucuronidase